MERLIKKYFTGYLHKLDIADLRGTEIAYWSILLLNLFMFFVNIFGGSLFFLFSVAGVAIMIACLNNYYRDKR